MKEISEGEVIQIAPPHKWGGCLAIVDEVKSFGCQAYVSIPHNDGQPPGQAFTRLNWEDFEPLGVNPVFVPATAADH